MKTLSTVWNSINRWLFPEIEDELGELSVRDKEFIRVVELTELEDYIRPYRWKGMGRRTKDRLCLAKAFIAKSVYKMPDRESLIDRITIDSTLRRLCGWESKGEIPSSPTFCRAFSEFADGELPQKLHETMTKQYTQAKLAGHMSRDSTPIPVREKPKKKNKVPVVKTKKRGRPRKGEERKKAPRRLELQPHRTLEENLEELPKVCDVGTKLDSKGKKRSWIGYRLHIDSIDGDIPVSCVLTSASVHDSQVAIPLAQMSKTRVTNLYDLMDVLFLE